MKKIEISNYSSLLFFITKACFLGICSNNLYNIARQDSWISIIIGGIFGIIPLLIYYTLLKKYPNKNIFEIISHICNKKIGTIINTILVVFIFVFASIVFYNLVDFISSQYLYKTPKLAIMIMFAICFFYLINNGIGAIARTSTVLIYLFIFLFLASIIGLSFQLDFSNIKPINEHGISPILEGSYQVLCLNVLPIFLLTVIPYNKINHKNNNFIKYSLISYILAILVIFSINLFILSIYGINLATLFQYPEFHLLKRLSLIGFIERFEDVLSIQWIFGYIIAIVLCLYAAKKYIFSFFKNKHEKKHIIIDIILNIGLIILTLNIYPNSTLANSFQLKYFGILTSIFFLLLPIIILFINNKKITK